MRVQAIIGERCGISGDSALRLGRYFGTTPGYWLNLQRDYELERAANALGSRLDTEVTQRTACGLRVIDPVRTANLDLMSAHMHFTKIEDQCPPTRD